MGGLRKRMPVTFWTFIIGTLALMGAPGLSGFFSKDSILMAAHRFQPSLFVIGLATAFLTAYYMTRLVVVAFLGKPRTAEAEHGHDGPFAMTAPLVILAVLSIVAGWPFIANGVFGQPFMHHLHEIPHVNMVVGLAIAVFVIGAVVGWTLYARAEKDPILIPTLRDKFYFDELYAALIAGTHDLLAKLSGWIDKWIIDGLLVRGLSGGAWGSGFVLRLFQFGNLQGYAFLFGVGVVALMYFVVFVN